MKKNTFRWLWVILVLAFVLRIWRVGSLPSILNRDEAAVAYNAFLLQETGRDEWQQPWPMTLESFGDYKLPGYSWHLIPFFTVLGRQDWVVRLPSVFAGTILVGLAYALARQLKLDEREALASSLMVAVAPVFVFYSRMAFEANVGLMYFVGAILALFSLRSAPNIRKYCVFGALLIAAVLTYNTPLLLLPFLMIAAVLLFPVKRRTTLIGVELLMALILIGGAVFLLPVASQKSGITIFTDETVWSHWMVWRESLPDSFLDIAGSRYVYFAFLAAKNFVATFSPTFLVTHGGTHPWHSLPTTGHLSLVVYGFGLLGIVKSVWQLWSSRKEWKKSRRQWALLFLFVTSLAPSVVTVDAPHATRSLLFFVLFHVYAAIGMGWFVSWFVIGKDTLVWRVLLAVLLAEGALHGYQLFGLYPTQQAALQPGFQSAVQKVEQDHPDDPIAVVDPLGYQYILLAWYLKLPAEQYFATAVRQQPDSIGFRYGERVTHYHFIAQPKDRAENETVLIQWSSQAQAWQVQENL